MAANENEKQKQFGEKNHLIISWGPPGSGKGHLLFDSYNEKTKDPSIIGQIMDCLYNTKTNLHDKNKTTRGLIDNLVELSRNYRRGSWEILQKYKQKFMPKNAPMSTLIDHMHGRDLDDLADELSALYMFVRYEKTIRIKSQSDLISKDDMVTENLKLAMKENKNAVLEMTGLNLYTWIYTWLFDTKNIDRQKTIITLVYPWVNKKHIVKATLNRLKKKIIEIEEYIQKYSFDEYYNANSDESKELGAVRLPNLSELPVNVEKTQENFAKLLEKDCGGDVDNIIMYDNNHGAGYKTTFLFSPKIERENKIKDIREKCQIVNNKQKLKNLFRTFPFMNAVLKKQLEVFMNKQKHNCPLISWESEVIAKEIVDQTGGKAGKKIKKVKKIRKHRGIHQTGGKAGKLKKGYKYSGKRLKNGQAEIAKCRSK